MGHGSLQTHYDDLEASGESEEGTMKRTGDSERANDAMHNSS